MVKRDRTKKTDAELYKLMLEHPNAVTRAVYRDILYRRLRSDEWPA